MTQDNGPMAGATKIRVDRLDEGALWRVTLASPKGNVIDETMTAELTELFALATAERKLKAVVLGAEGSHFSFGASVEEHRAEQVAGMLAGFHALFRAIAASGVPVVAGTRGFCLGGGLELVAFCHHVVAHPGATFGQPEISLGVIAPVASVILAERLGRGAADDLLISGRNVKAEEALRLGLVDELADDPDEAALAWARGHLLPKSASSLRFATRAARLAFMRRFDRDIAELETLYHDELMKTDDANEGIAAFLEKRDPVWRNA